MVWCIAVCTYPSLADPEGGGLRGLQPPFNFQKRGVTSVAIVISTVSTVSEQEQNVQGRRDVGKSVHVRQARRLSRETRVRAENCKQSGLQ